jgi:hypothetical protein
VFVDGDPSNDFYGTRYDASAGVLVPGELQEPLAGAGGGAGGDAVPGSVFPSQPWTPFTDQKGAAGGGGGGQVDLRALGPLGVAGPGAGVRVAGGRGAWGENTLFNDHVGGGSGGGSGGHLILAAPTVDLSGAGSNALHARGGLGGEGKSGIDSINAGGDGGPGLIQVHAQTLLLPAGQTLGDVSSPDALALVPFVASEARARSLWIPVRHAAAAPGGTMDRVAFAFGGTDSTTGAVLDQDADALVDSLPPLLGPALLAAAPALPHLGSDPRTVVFEVSSLAGTFDDVVLRNPALLRQYAVRLSLAADPASFSVFDVSAASYRSGTQTLRVVVDSTGPALTSFGGGAAVAAALVPRYLRLETAGIPDYLPPNHGVRVLWQGTGQTATGAPDDASPLTGWLGDPLQLSLPGLAFYRFEVVFDLGPPAGQLGAAPSSPALDFLRLPFRF